MNLVKLITDQLSSDAIAKLSALLGIDSRAAESTVRAAVPSLLAGLTKLSSQDDGLRRLTGVLNGLDEGMFGNFDRMLNGDAGQMLQKGSRMLGNLFGDDLTTNLTTALGRFAGLNANTVQSLLAYVTPLVLGRVASHWRNQGGTPSALKNLFAEQQQNIADAVPMGFSLGDVPGLAGVGDVVRSATRAAQDTRTATRSVASTLLPLALVLLGAFLLWNFLWDRPDADQARRPELSQQPEEVVAMKPVTPESLGLPEVARLKDGLTDWFRDANATFAAMKDAASANAALPQLEELNRKIDAFKSTLAALPESARTALDHFVAQQFEPLKTQATETLKLPGLGERIKSLIQELVRKLQEMHINQHTP